MEVLPNQKFTPADLDFITEHVVSQVETDKVIGGRVAQSVVRVLSTNPALGATLMDFLEENFPHSVLSRDMILRGKEEGWVHIDPFKAARVKTSSYDISLGEYFWVTPKLHPGSHVFNPYNPEHVKEAWEGPWRALTIREHLTLGVGPFSRHLKEEHFQGLDLDDPVIILEPQQTILAHTDEFIGAEEKATTMMKARSSIGRIFLSVCKDAGWGDVGYFNRWTMEIQNNLSDMWTFIPVHQPIAQMVFFRVNSLKGGSQYFEEGNYQTSQTIIQLKKEWKPENMLPRLRKVEE